MRGNQFQISGTFTAKALPFKNNNASCYLACEYSRLSFGGSRNILVSITTKVYQMRQLDFAF